MLLLRLSAFLAAGLFITLSPLTHAAAPPPGPPSLKQLWTDLASADARQGYAALCRLADQPAQAVPFLRVRLRPAVAVDAKRLARLIADLDHDSYATRQRASADLAALGHDAQPALAAALKRKPSAEVRRRLNALLRKLEVPISSPRLLRQIRAVEALERMATPAARTLLRELAKGASAARLTQEASESLQRLDRRPLSPLRPIR